MLPSDPSTPSHGRIRLSRGRLIAAAATAAMAAALSSCAWTEPEPTQTLAVKVSDGQGSPVPQAFCRAANDRGVWPFVAPGEVTVPKSAIPLDITCEDDSRTGFVRALPQMHVWSPAGLASVGAVHEVVDPLRYPAVGYPPAVEVIMGRTGER